MTTLWESFWLWSDRISIMAFYLLPTIAIIWRKKLRRWWRRNQFDRIGGVIQKNKRWDAIVCMPSNNEVGKYLIHAACPSKIGLICTQWSSIHAGSLKQWADDLGLEEVSVLAEESDDPAYIKQITKLLIEQLKDRGSKNIAVDITGGMKPNSIGMFMAAEEEGCDSIYVGSKWSPDTHEIIPNTRRLVLVSSPSTY